jgi:hypothetical protein
MAIPFTCLGDKVDASLPDDLVESPLFGPAPQFTADPAQRRRRIRTRTPMNAIVLIALKRPYTFVVLAILILIFGGRAAVSTPTDIFPNIGIPVVAVVWTYSGLTPRTCRDGSSITTSAR